MIFLRQRKNASPEQVVLFDQSHGRESLVPPQSAMLLGGCEDVASGVLNAARQSGGALGVAVLGSLLGRGHALSLHVPLLVATAGYLVAIVLAWTTIRDR